jgi:hypothetical protein
MMVGGCVSRKVDDVATDMIEEMMLRVYGYII